MANYNSTYTGAEVDAAVAKSQALTTATDINDAVTKSQALPAAADVISVVDTLTENTASAGDVLTANGAGSASWETPSGGGSQLYAHNITIMAHCNAANMDMFHFQLITPDATAYTSSNICAKLQAYYNNPNYGSYPLEAFVACHSPNVFGIGSIDFSGSTLKYRYWLCDLPNTPVAYTSTSSQKPTFHADYVTAL